MIATIQLTPYVHVQGEVKRSLPGGRVAILLDGLEYIGRPLVAPMLRAVRGEAAPARA